MKRQFFFLEGFWLCAGLVLFLLWTKLCQAYRNGADPHTCADACPWCRTCALPNLQAPAMAGSVSYTQGNVLEQVNASTTRSAFGPTINLSLIYNSYDADASRAAVDTVMGYGWTHSYNLL